MDVLTISDEVAPLVYNLNIKQRFRDVQLVLSCGDLSFSYLEFVVTMLGVPCVYVRGNHDGPEITYGGQVLAEPGGWQCAEDRCVREQGLLIAGLGGSIRYNGKTADQYTERQMHIRAWRLVPRLLFNRYRHGRYLDMLITHAPPLGIHNGPDFPHRGFRAFLWLMERFTPRYLIHGHIHHSYTYGSVFRTQYHATLVLNTAGYLLLDVAAPEPQTHTNYKPLTTDN